MNGSKQRQRRHLLVQGLVIAVNALLSTALSKGDPILLPSAYWYERSGLRPSSESSRAFSNLGVLGPYSPRPLLPTPPPLRLSPPFSYFSNLRVVRRVDDFLSFSLILITLSSLWKHTWSADKSIFLVTNLLSLIGSQSLMQFLCGTHPFPPLAPHHPNLLGSSRSSAASHSLLETEIAKTISVAVEVLCLTVLRREIPPYGFRADNDISLF